MKRTAAGLVPFDHLGSSCLHASTSGLLRVEASRGAGSRLGGVLLVGAHAERRNCEIRPSLSALACLPVWLSALGV